MATAATTTTTTTMMSTTTTTKIIIHDNNFQQLEKELDAEAIDLQVDLLFKKILQDKSILPVLSKPIRSTCISDYFDEDSIPDYLLPTNTDLLVKILPELHRTRNHVQMEQLYTLAVLAHYMLLINLQINLWTTCFKSGTGQLRPVNLKLNLSTPPGLHVWPKLVRTMMINQKFISLKDYPDDHDEIPQEIYLKFVQDYRSNLDQEYKQFENRFHQIQKSLVGYTEEMTEIIGEFIRKHEAMMVYQLYFDARIALIKHDYTDRLLKYEFFQQNPTEDQIEKARTIIQLTFNLKKASREWFLYYDGVYYKKLPRPLNLLEYSPPDIFANMKDIELRDRLTKQYIRLIEETKFNVMNILKMGFRSLRDLYANEYFANIDRIWQQEHELPLNDQLSSKMVTLIEDRQENITETMKNIYTWKARFLGLRPCLQL